MVVTTYYLEYVRSFRRKVLRTLYIQRLICSKQEYFFFREYSKPAKEFVLGLDKKMRAKMLRTIEILKQQRDDFELNVIHDYDAPEFKAFVKEHHLEDCVIFHGKKTSAEVAEAYQKADFLVLFSNFENLPCVIVEAFASGIPVLSTAVGGIAEIVSPERGILIPQGDEDALLQGMNQMLDHSDEYDRQVIRQYALNTFSNDIIGRQIYEVYSKVLEKD